MQHAVKYIAHFIEYISSTLSCLAILVLHHQGRDKVCSYAQLVSASKHDVYCSNVQCLSSGRHHVAIAQTTAKV